MPRRLRRPRSSVPPRRRSCRSAAARHAARHGLKLRQCAQPLRDAAVVSGRAQWVGKRRRFPPPRRARLPLRLDPEEPASRRAMRTQPCEAAWPSWSSRFRTVHVDVARQRIAPRPRLSSGSSPSSRGSREDQSSSWIRRPPLAVSSRLEHGAERRPLRSWNGWVQPAGVRTSPLRRPRRPPRSTRELGHRLPAFDQGQGWRATSTRGSARAGRKTARRNGSAPRGPERARRCHALSHALTIAQRIITPK